MEKWSGTTKIQKRVHNSIVYTTELACSYVDANEIWNNNNVYKIYDFNWNEMKIK